MSEMKDFFLAGLTVEQAREQRDVARGILRDAAAKACPDELGRLDAASADLTKAEEHFAEVVQGMMTGARQAMTKQWMVDHAATCDNPQCAIRQALLKVENPAGSKLN